MPEYFGFCVLLVLVCYVILVYFEERFVRGKSFSSMVLFVTWYVNTGFNVSSGLLCSCAVTRW